MAHLNKTVSLLRSEGHPNAHHYPIWMVWDEAKITIHRINRKSRTDAMVMFKVMGAALVGGDAVVKDLSKFLSENFKDGSEDF